VQRLVELGNGDRFYPGLIRDINFDNDITWNHLEAVKNQMNKDREIKSHNTTLIADIINN